MRKRPQCVRSQRVKRQQQKKNEKEVRTTMDSGTLTKEAVWRGQQNEWRQDQPWATLSLTSAAGADAEHWSSASSAPRPRTRQKSLRPNPVSIHYLIHFLLTNPTRILWPVTALKIRLNVFIINFFVNIKIK